MFKAQPAMAKPLDSHTILFWRTTAYGSFSAYAGRGAYQVLVTCDSSDAVFSQEATQNAYPQDQHVAAIAAAA